jgi:hypothetical protein
MLVDRVGVGEISSGEVWLIVLISMTVGVRLGHGVK